jgi:hypothetical protein
LLYSCTIYGFKTFFSSPDIDFACNNSLSIFISLITPSSTTGPMLLLIKKSLSMYSFAVAISFVVVNITAAKVYEW